METEAKLSCQVASSWKVALRNSEEIDKGEMIQEGILNQPMKHKERALKPGLKFDVSQEQEIAHGDPDLGQDGISRGAQEGFDFQMLFDPLKKQLHMPAGLINFSDGQSRQLKVVGKELVSDSGVGIEIADQAQGFGVFLLGQRTGQFDGAVKNNAVFCGDFLLSGNAVNDVVFGPSDEKGFSFVDTTEPVEIDIAPVNDIDAVRHQVQEGLGGSDIGAFAIRDNGKRRDLALDIQLAMELDGSLGLAELGPREKFQTEIDGAGVKSAHGIFEAELMFGGDGLAAVHQPVEKPLHDSAITLGVGIGQGRAFDRGQAQMVELGLLGAQGYLDIAQTDLGTCLSVEKHGELIPGGELFDVGIAAEVRDGLVKLMSGKKREQLVQNCVRMHVENPPSVVCGCQPQIFYQ